MEPPSAETVKLKAPPPEGSPGPTLCPRWVPVKALSLSSGRRRREQLPAQLLDLVSELGGVLEAQLLGGRVHLLLEGDDEPLELPGAHAPTLRGPRAAL